MSQKQPSAFSLIELLIVFTIIIFISTITIPNQDFFSKILLDHEVGNLFTTLTFLHHKAIASNKKCKLFFDLSTNSYFYFNGTTKIIHYLPTKITFGYLSHVKGPPSSPKKIITKAITFYNNKIIFYPQGTISPGTIYLVDSQKKFFKALTCSISQVSFLRIYHYTWSPTKQRKSWI